MILFNKSITYKRISICYRSSSSITRLYSGGRIRDGLGIARGYANNNNRYILETHTLSGLPEAISLSSSSSSSSSSSFIVLGIESSCDDTGVAIVKSDGTILSNIVLSQHEIHEKFGGVVPSLAMEAHRNNIDIAVEKALQEAGLKSINEVDAISVTKGPGLEICLRVGVRKAQSLSRQYSKPFVTIHHLEAHCLMARLAGNQIKDDTNTISNTGDNNSNSSNNNDNQDNSIMTNKNQYNFSPKIEYPFLALLASGGHTSLQLVLGLGKYLVLGGTLDDSLGEAFDKASRLLGLRTGGSGGAAVEAAARLGVCRREHFSMTIPMQNKPNCDFSYAGLKNSFRVAVQNARQEYGLDVDSTNAPLGQNMEAPEPVMLPEAITADLCATFQDTAFSHVEERISRALDYIDDRNITINGLVVVGGVAANKELRRRLLKLLSSRCNAINEEMNLSSINNNNDNSSNTTTNNDDKNINTNTNNISIKPIPLIFPPPNLCTDNGVMAAWAGIEKLYLGISDAVDDVEPISRWPLGEPIENGKVVFPKRKYKKQS